MRELPNSLEKRLRDVRKGGGVEVYERVDLKAWTALGVGGYGDVLIRCNTASAVHQVLDLLASHGVQWLTIGAGTRIVAPERGLRIPLVNLTGEVGRWQVGKDGVVAGGGAKLAQVCLAAARGGLSGLESLANSPGSVGGVLASVVTRRPHKLAELVEWIEHVQPGVGVVREDAVDASPSMGPGLLRRRMVISGARFRAVGPGKRWTVGSVAATRLRSGPFRSRAASRVFHDPEEGTAVELLESAGCSGLKVGGASVADWSPNAIVANRVCTSSDVVRLVLKMRDLVKRSCDVDLEPRLVLIDEYGGRIES